jgi:DNA polymerase alpha subunit B
MGVSYILPGLQSSPFLLTFFSCNSYPQAPLQDRLPNGKFLQNVGGGDVEFGSLGLNRLIKGKENRVHCLSNPCTFRINEVVFGVSSTDVIFQISAEETNSNLEPGSRLRRIAQHMVQQRSYYPLYPPPASMPTNLDLKQIDGFKMPCRPDILIVPSRLTAFASLVLDSTVVVNPGHLTKGSTGGTYAIMDIHPIKREKLDDAADDVLLQHCLNDRVNVEVKRI